MKKSILFLIIFLSVAGICSAQNKQQQFFYYPSVNIYHNATNGLYSYKNGPTWKTSKSLPANVTLKLAPKIVVYHATPNVWENNHIHIAKYKIMKAHRARGVYNSRLLKENRK